MRALLARWLGPWIDKRLREVVADYEVMSDYAARVERRADFWRRQHTALKTDRNALAAELAEKNTELQMLRADLADAGIIRCSCGRLARPGCDTCGSRACIAYAITLDRAHALREDR